MFIGDVDMIRWEYDVETVYENEPEGICYPLDELGEVGWELVSVVPCAIRGGYVCFFKRPYKTEYEYTEETRLRLTDEDLAQFKIGGTD